MDPQMKISVIHFKVVFFFFIKEDFSSEIKTEF